MIGKSVSYTHLKRSIAPTYENCSAEAIGAIAGKVTSDTIASTLLIQNVSAVSYTHLKIR